MTTSSTSKSWRESLVKSQPVALGRSRGEPRAFRRARRKDSWTKEFKRDWEPMADWKLPRKIREVREGSDDYVSVLEADLGGSIVKAKLVPGVTIPGQVEKVWRIRLGWDREAYGRSVHDEFAGWVQHLLPGPDGNQFIAYEGELYRLLGDRYSSRVSGSELEAAVQKLIAMRFECRYRPTLPTPLIVEKPKKHIEEDEERTPKKRKLTQAGESRRTKKAKRERLLSLPTDEYVGNGGHTTLSIPPDPEPNLEIKQATWDEQRERWCQGLSAIAKRHGVQVDWFLEITHRRCRLSGLWVETPHYHLLWRRHRRDRFTFEEVRELFVAQLQKLAASIWPINRRGLHDRPICNKHHMQHLQGNYLAKASNIAEMCWGRYFGRVNPARTKLTANLTREQHFALRRVQSRAINHHLPHITVDVSGRMGSTNLIKALEALGVHYRIETNIPLAEVLVTVVSQDPPDTSPTQAPAKNEDHALVYNERTPPSRREIMNTIQPTSCQSTCGYHIISPCEVFLREGFPLYRSLDAIPDTRRIDLGQFSIEIDQVEQWALDHPLARPMCVEDRNGMEEAMRRSQRVLLPVFVNQWGKLMAGAESIRAVAMLQSEGTQVESIPVVCIHVENDAAEAELVLALNYGLGGGETQSKINQRRRAAVRALLLAGHDGTDRLIAGLCGLKDTTPVKQTRLDLEEEGLIERRIEFVDRRGSIQRRAERYDAPEAERQEDVAEVSGPDTSENRPQDERTLKPQVAMLCQEASNEGHCQQGWNLFLLRWHQSFGERPVWPEELESFAAECAVEVPVGCGRGGGFEWTEHQKPDGSDRVLVLHPAG